MRPGRFGVGHCLVIFAALLCFATASANPQEKVKLNDILAAFDSQPLDTERLDKAKAVMDAPLPAGITDPPTLARLHWERARAAGTLGLVMPQITDMRQVIALGGADNPGRAWRELGQAEFLGGNFKAAIDARLKAAELTPANMKGRLISEYAGLADLYRRIGDFETARRYVRDAEGLLVVLRAGRAWNDYQYTWQTTVEDALGRIEFANGHYLEAEARFLKAMDLLDRDLPLNPLRLARGMESAPQYQLENYRDSLESWLASALWKQGKLFEAEVHARNAAYNSIRRGGQDSIQANANIQQLILVLAEQNRLEPALQLVDRVSKNFERQGLPANAFLVARNQRLRANILTGLGRWQEALRTFESTQAALADSGLANTLGGPSLGWIRTLMAVGQNAAAADMANGFHAQLKKELGASAYETVEAQGYLAAALARNGQAAQSLAPFREAIAVLLPAAAAQTDRSSRRFRRLSFIVESYLSVLAELRRQSSDKQTSQGLVAEAFAIADALRGQSVQQAMAASAARAAASSPQLATLVRQEQDARQERDALNVIQADLMSRRADQVPAAILADMRQRVSGLDSRLKTLSENIRQGYPEYAELVTPRPATLQSIKSVLKPGEALLSILSSDEQTYIWAIPATGEAAFAVSPDGRKAVDKAVNALRASLDPGDVDFAQLPAFDGKVAHELYKQLLLPVQAGWQGANHLIVAAGGALGRLPLSVLLTAPPPPGAKTSIAFDQYATWPWLIRDMAVSQLPAANSLPTLRRMQPGAVGRLALAGFGDPDFGGSKASAQTRHLRSTLRSSTASDTTPNFADYSRIPPLPDTRDEIIALAGALGANTEHDVFLGKQASRAMVMENKLSDRKVIAFATHGLLAGEYPGVEQPALALANPGGGQHGLLTLDDILSLKLDADWVILSACNTSAGDGAGGEAISGLGRGFFYAGTRALLVTHWPVETVSAKQLVVGIFQSLAETPDLSRASALQKSMLKVMTQEGKEGKFRFSYAHPMFWAPYALVGDGGK